MGQFDEAVAQAERGTVDVEVARHVHEAHRVGHGKSAGEHGACRLHAFPQARAVVVVKNHALARLAQPGGKLQHALAGHRRQDRQANA